MKEQTNIGGYFFRKILAASPKIVLLLLALLNLFTIPVRCNWGGEFFAASIILIAVFALWVGRSWSYFVAILSCCLIIYDFCRTLLLYFGFLLLPPNVEASEVQLEEWFRIMQNHPEEFTQTVLATIVLIVAVYYLLNTLKQNQRIFR